MNARPHASHRSRRRLAATFIAVVLAAAACTDDASHKADSATTTAPETSGGESASASTETTQGATSDGPLSPDEIVTADRIAYSSAACGFDQPPEVTVDCGALDVPVHWDQRGGTETLTLQVATFTTSETPTDATPLLYLEGGPGGDALGFIDLSFDGTWGDIVSERPLVIFTQRGSALSTIDLECEELAELALDLLDADPAVDTEAREDTAAETCFARLRDEGADFSAYHTVNSAHDAEAVRLALGHDSWNVLGISYGTRLGQEMARVHPDAIDALILDSVQPTSVTTGSLASLPTTADRAFDHLFTACATDPACAEAFPDLENRFWAMVDAANAEPLSFQALDLLTAEPYDVVANGDDLVGMVFSALYSRETFAAVPQMVADYEAGVSRVPASLTGLEILQLDAVSTGLYSSVMCHDYLSALTPDEAFTTGLSGDDRIDDVFAADIGDVRKVCPLLETGSADPALTEPVTSDIPTLIMAGEYDPITPPSFAESILPGFANGQYVVLPHVGHGLVSNDCGESIVMGFLRDPSAEVDRACIAEIPAPIWVPGSLADVALVPFADDTLGTVGVAPDGWTDLGFGVFGRTDTNLARPATVVQQAVPIPGAELAALFGQQIGAEFAEVESLDLAGRTWVRHETTLADATVVDLWVHDADGTSLALLTQVAADDIDATRQGLAPRLLAELTLG